jgi:hypothetical protein
MNFPSIRIEGAILSPDILDRIEDAPGQKPADFGLDASSKVKDEIARAWADAQDYWRIFQRKLDAQKLHSVATTETRQQWIVPILGLLGYQLEYQSKGAELNGKTYAISHRAINRAQTPVHIVGYRDPAGLDRKPDGASLRMSPHAMVQEYINLHEQLYGIVTNGRVLRLLRDSSRLVKLSYLEFDLDRIFTDGLFADFAILYRLLHATRLPITSDTAAESLIERYHQDSLDSGARIRDGLSHAVEQAIRDFGNGFLAHPANTALRAAVADGTLTPETYYKHLLNLIYRLLFLMVIEERGLIFPPAATAKQREIYRRYYSVQRLRLLSEKRYLADPRRHDHWLALTATFRLFEAEGPGAKLGLAPLAGDLFGFDAIGLLSQCLLGNDVLLGCLRSLSLYEHPDNRQLIRVNYAALNVEEFGSVYEGLLEYEPVFLNDGSHVSFDFTQKGEERAATGSHYTPDELVQPLIKHSLDYLIADKLKEKDPEKALLSLRIADISCGSGHILLAAARRVATELATVRTGEEQPSPTAYRTALRDTIRECIYGVDLNPLAVELCKVALWLEAHNPGQPLNFLDHHIKCGNSIVGFVRREELDKGVPDEAFKFMPGDDKEIASQWRKRNKIERETQEKQQQHFKFSPAVRDQLDAILKQWNLLSALPERTPAEIGTKKARFMELAANRDTWTLKQIAAMPIAQFYTPKTPENDHNLISDDQFRHYWNEGQTPQGQASAWAWSTAHQKRFFHWFLEFPEIIEGGGFDCVLGNPPYLGGGKLSTTYGSSFNAYVKQHFAPANGQVDLLCYFVRRIYDLLSPTGRVGLIGTGTVAQGDSRIAGIQHILDCGGCMTFAYTARKWPGKASVDVALFGFSRKHCSKVALNDRLVASINSSLSDDNLYAEPLHLASQSGLSFKGSEPVGDGFLLSHIEADQLANQYSKESACIKGFLIGDDVSNSPLHEPSRKCIYFSSISLPDCETVFPHLLHLIRTRVYPERSNNADKRRREIWWQFSRPTVELYKTTSRLSRVFVLNRHAKYLAVSVVSPKFIYSDATVVIAKDKWESFALYSSNIHEAWAWFRGSTMGSSTLRYTPTSVFETYVEPSLTDELGILGKRYHDHRKSLMLSLWLGLTDIYNLFHARHLSPALVAKVSKKTADEAERGYNGILELRRLHIALDTAVRDAYGWQDLPLGHDFYEIETLPENDRVRYTISPAARKELLKRLLALNHARAAEEAASNASALTSKTKRGRKANLTNQQADLFT